MSKINVVCPSPLYANYGVGMDVPFHLAEVTRYLYEKNYGFAKLPDGKIVFFYQTRQNEIRSNGETLVLVPHWTEPFNGGSKIYVSLNEGPKGLRADKWIKASLVDAATQHLQDMKPIRLVQRTGRIAISRLQEKPQIRVLWEGKNLDDLTRKFPKNHYRLHDTEFHAVYMQQQDQDGQWMNISEDPRTNFDLVF